MKKISITILAASFALAAVSQKTINEPNAQKRQVPSFTGIEVGGGIDLYLSQGTEAVAVSASETKYRDNIITEVKNGVLHIYYDAKSNFHGEWGNRKLKAYVSFKNLDQLEGSGGSDIKVDGTITVPKLSLHVSGGSDFDGKVNINDLKVDASGGSDVEISGTAKELNVEASGGSDFKGYELITDNTTVDASGGSDIYITVNKELNATSSGGSDIHYKGNGLIRNINGSSSNIKKVSK